MHAHRLSSKLGSTLFYYLISFILLVPLRLIGLRCHGRENMRQLRGRGLVVVTQHMHYLDSVMAAYAVSPRRLHFVSLAENTKLPMWGWILRVVRVIPIDGSLSLNRYFMETGEALLRRGGCLLIYPNGELCLRQTEPQTFKNGAFYVAAKAGSPILPLCFYHRKRSLPRRILGLQGGLTLQILPPVYPPNEASAHDSLRVSSACGNKKEGVPDVSGAVKPDGVRMTGEPLTLKQQAGFLREESYRRIRACYEMNEYRDEHCA